MVVKSKKGYSLMLDATFSVFIVISIIASAGIYIVKAQESPFKETSALHVANNIIDVMHRTGVLENFDNNTISAELASLLPPAYDMRLEIMNFTSIGGYTNSIWVGSTPPTDIEVLKSRRPFVTQNGLGLIKYEVWLRE